MYAYLNDISAREPGVSEERILPLLTEFISVFSGLRDYKIEKLRVPNGFKSDIRLFEKLTIKDLISTLAGEGDADVRIRIVTLLNSVEEIRPADHEAQIAQAEQNRLIQVMVNNIASDMLSDAEILKLPVISFRSRPEFESHFIACQMFLLTTDNQNLTDVTLPNFYCLDSLTQHHEWLLPIHHDLIFAEKRWSPFDNPSWREEVTKRILTIAKYPGNRNTLSVDELRSLNMNAAKWVLEANGWKFNRVITNYNTGKAAIWRIYSNFLTNESIYISVDLGEGEFEMQDRRGKWRVTRFFDGSPTGKNYGNDSSHNIRVRN